MHSNSGHTFEQQILVNVINIRFVLGKYQHWWGRLLEAFQQIYKLGLWLHPFNLLWLQKLQQKGSEFYLYH
jgi:hypothetical protein